MKRAYLATATLLAAALVSNEASAWVQFCNKSSSGLYATYGYYVKNPSKVYGDCGFSSLSGDCGYNSTWRSEGWWRIEAGACTTVYGSAITNRYSYFQVIMDNGNYISDGPAFWVDSWNGFTHDQYTDGPWYGSGECVGTIGQGLCVPQNWYQVGHRMMDTGSYKNFTMNIY